MNTRAIPHTHRSFALLASFGAASLLYACTQQGTEKPIRASAGGSDGGGGAGGSPNLVGKAGGSSIPDVPAKCSRKGDDSALTSGAGSESFALLWDTDHYVFVYNDAGTGSGDLYVQTLGLDGKAKSAPVLLDATPAPSEVPSIAKTANGYVVAWQETSSPPHVRIKALDASASPVGSSIDLPTNALAEARPVVSATPTGAVVVWMDATGGVPSAYLSRLDATGALAGASSRTRLGTAKDGATFPWVAGDATHEAVLWSDRRDGQYDIRFSTLTGSPATLDGTKIRTAMGDAQLGRIIRAGDRYAATWEDGRAGDGNEIFIALVDDAGKATTLGPVENKGTGDANWPHVAYDGERTAIVYYQFRDDDRPEIFLSLVSQDGKRDGGDLRVSPKRGQGQAGKSRYPDIQWAGSEFGVAYVDSREGATQVYFARVTCEK